MVPNRRYCRPRSHSQPAPCAPARAPSRTAECLLLTAKHQPRRAGSVRSAPHPWCRALLVGDIAHPALQVGLQCRPALKAPSGNRVLLHIADAALVLALGARPIRCTGVWAKTPVLGEGAQSRIELDLAGRPVVACHQSAIIVEQHLFGDPTKMTERALDTGKPALLALIAKRPDIKPP